MKTYFDFTAENGVPFRCRIVMPGERYGLELCLTNEKKPMVEFYDARYAHDYEFVGKCEDAIAAGAPCLGQFVTRYYVSTLRESRDPRYGLCLDAGIQDWRIDPESLAAVHAWMDTQVPGTPVIKAHA